MKHPLTQDQTGFVTAAECHYRPGLIQASPASRRHPATPLAESVHRPQPQFQPTKHPRPVFSDTPKAAQSKLILVGEQGKGQE